MNEDELKTIVRDGVKEALANHKCFCNLMGEGISPATHVEHHRTINSIKADMSKLKIGAVLAVFTAAIVNGWKYIAPIIGVPQ